VWYLEGVDDLDEDKACYKIAFYVLLKQMYQPHNYTTVLLTKLKYDKICLFYINLLGSVDAQTKVLERNKQAYEWEEKYYAVIVGASAILVLHSDAAADVWNIYFFALAADVHMEAFC
jgi:hypothetical protein